MATGNLRKVAFIIVGSEIHILEHGLHMNGHIVIRAPCVAVTASLITSTSQASSVIIATRDNQVWLVPMSQLLQDDFRRKMICEFEKEEKMDSEDIFGDILNDKAWSDKSNLDCLKNKHTTSESAHIFTIRPQHLLYNVDGTVIDMEALDDLVCVLMDRSEIAEVHIFKVCTEQQSNVSGNGSRIILLESFTTGLYSSSFFNYCLKKTKCLFFVQSVRKKCMDTVSTSSTFSRSLMVSQTSLCIPSQLFTTLFGKEAACLSSPIIMFCTDSGCVYSYELKSVKSVLQKRLNVVCQMDSDIVGILPIKISRPTVDGISQFRDVVSALASSLREESTVNISNQTSTSLVIFSSTGQGCLFVPPTPENDYQSVVMFSLPHSVNLCIVHGESIIYSTGNSVEACDLKLMQVQGDGSFYVTPVVRTLMGKARIHKLLPFALVNGAEDTMISGITCSFDVVHICTQLKEAEQNSKAEVNQSLKDILQCIEECSLTFKSLKKDSLCIDSFLLQLNIFASLAKNKEQNALADMKPCSLDTVNLSDSVINCLCSVLSTQNVYKQNWGLKIVLQNTSTISLSKDWMVLVTLCDSKEGLYYHVNERFNHSFSNPLSRGLKSKSSIDICLPLDRLIQIHPIPSIDIKVFLVLTLRNVSNEKINMARDLFQKSVKVEIHRQKIDIWHFLHEFNDQSLNSEFRSEHSSFSGAVSGDEGWLHKELDTMAQTRITGKIKDHPVTDKAQILNMRIGISDFECKEHKIFNSTDALLFLLKDSKIEANRILGSHIQLEDPHGHTITLVVSFCIAVPENSDKPSSEVCPLVVILKGEDVNLLLEARAAIRSKLKVHSTEASMLQSKSCAELRKQKTFLEGVQKDLHHIRSRLVTNKSDEEELVRLLCEMIDKSEHLTINN